LQKMKLVEARSRTRPARRTRRMRMRAPELHAAAVYPTSSPDVAVLGLRDRCRRWAAPQASGRGGRHMGRGRRHSRITSGRRRTAPPRSDSRRRGGDRRRDDAAAVGPASAWVHGGAQAASTYDAGK
jgi:hypothetical protein